MSDHVMEPSDAEGGFDVTAVAMFVGRAPLLDDLGRSDFEWQAGGVLVAPDGAMAVCDATVIDEAWELAFRRLTLGTEGASLFAKAIAWLDFLRRSRPTLDQALPAESIALRLIRSFRFDQFDQLHRIVALFARHGFDIPGSPEIRTDVSDVLNPRALERQFRLGRVYVNEQQHDRGPFSVVVVSHPAGQIGFNRRRRGELLQTSLTRPLSGGRVGYRIVELPPASVLLLIAVHEGLRYAGGDEVLQEKLLGLRRTIVPGLVDVLVGYRQLTELFHPTSWPAAADGLAPGQLNAIAIAAMGSWAARGDGGPIDRRSVRQRLIAVTAREPVELGGECVLRFKTGALVARVEGDLYVVRARTIYATGELASVSTVLSAEKLVWVAWAMASRDSLDGELADALAGYAYAALSRPSFDVRRATPSVLAALIKAAVGRGRVAAAAREILARRPADHD